MVESGDQTSIYSTRFGSLCTQNFTANYEIIQRSYVALEIDRGLSVNGMCLVELVIAIPVKWSSYSSIP